MRKLIFVFVLLMVVVIGRSQDRNWKEEKSKDGRVLVKSEILKKKDANGDKKLIVYYIAEITENISLQKALDYMREPENYKQFLENTEKSESVKKVSDKEWITYLYFDAPWPLPNSDCVQRYQIDKSEIDELIISATVDADAYPLQKVKRMQFYDAKYHFKRLNEEEVKLTLSAAFIPVGSVSKWMLNTWLPKGPAGIVSKLMDKLK